jgi:RNA polymerase sigma-70 factor (ECF subfamily)
MQLSHHEPESTLYRVRETDLIEKVKNGERNAFEELERRFRPKIINQLRRLCHNENEAEDIFQEVMVTLYLKLNTFEGKSTLSTWIYRITLNAFLMHERKQKRQQLLLTEGEYNEAYSGTAVLKSEAETGAYIHMENSEFHVTLARAVSELPKGYRDVFLMRNKDELPIKEVSKRLGISVPAVKSRNRRARQFLKSRLEGYYYN